MNADHTASTLAHESLNFVRQEPLYCELVLYNSNTLFQNYLKYIPLMA